MKKRLLATVLILTVISFTAVGAFAQSYKEHVTTLSNYYGVDRIDVMTYFDELGDWGDVDRALYISSRTGASPDLIVQAYLDGETFTEIADDYQMPNGTFNTPVLNVPLVVDLNMAQVLAHHYGLDPATVSGYYSTLQSWGDVERALFIANKTGVSADTIVQQHANGEAFSIIAQQDGMTGGLYYTPIADMPLWVG